MTAREFRIGNYVTDIRGDVCQVEFIGKDGSIGVSTLEYSGQLGFNNLNEDFKPIPITEEWLGKSGFVRRFTTDADWYYPREKITLMISGNSANAYWVNKFIREIQYVHQLQNLYYALTGEELEVKQEIGKI